MKQWWWDYFPELRDQDIAVMIPTSKIEYVAWMRYHGWKEDRIKIEIEKMFGAGSMNDPSLERIKRPERC